MNHSRIMALLIAGGLVCGGFAAFAADNAKPAEAKPAEEKPVEAKPAKAKPAEVKPVEVKPAEAKPTEVKPAEAKPVEAKPAEVKSAEAKPATEAKPVEDPFNAIPSVLAEIGDQKITKDMVIEFVLKNTGGQLSGVSADEIKNVLPVLAKKIVMENILDLELAKAGIKPSEEMARAKQDEQFKKMDKEQLAIITQQLQMQGMTLDQFIDKRAKDSDFQKQIATLSYLEGTVLKKVKDKIVAPDEVQKFYEANKDRWFKKADPDKPDQLRASHILIASDGKDAEADRKAKEKAEQLIKILKEKPGEFETIAKDNSSCPSSAKGGDLGVFDKGRMVPEFEKAVLALKDGEITSAPVKTQFGYHIIRRNPLKTKTEWIPFEEAKADIERHLKDRELQKALMEYFSQLEKEYKVKYLVEIPTEQPAL